MLLQPLYLWHFDIEHAHDINQTPNISVFECSFFDASEFYIYTEVVPPGDICAKCDKEA